MQHGRSNGGTWGYTDSMGIDGIAGHTPWELHFCVLFRASCCLEDTGGRSLASTSTTSSCSSTRLCGKKLFAIHSSKSLPSLLRACLLFFFRFCLRSHGTIFDGRACNICLVELCQFTNTQLIVTCTLYYHVLYYQQHSFHARNPRRLAQSGTPGRNKLHGTTQTTTD